MMLVVCFIHTCNDVGYLGHSHMLGKRYVVSTYTYRLIEAITGSGSRAIHLAVEHRHADITMLLLQFSVNIYAQV